MLFSGTKIIAPHTFRDENGIQKKQSLYWLHLVLYMENNY